MFANLKHIIFLLKITIKEDGWCRFFKKIFLFLTGCFSAPLQKIILPLLSIGARRECLIKKRTPLAIKAVGSLPSPADLPLIDIIIVTYNSEDYIASCIESIGTSLYPQGKIHVTIVDNGSRDDTVGVLEAAEYEAKLKLIKSGKNLGFGEANNRGFQEATGDYVLFLNPDTELRESTLNNLVCHALNTEQYGFAAWEARQSPYEHPKVYDPVTLETEWVSGAGVLIASEAFKAVGGFDDNIFLYGEDVDLSWRLRMAGYHLMYIPRALVNHYAYEGEDVIKPTQFFNSITTNGILRYKYGSFRDIVAFYFMTLSVLALPPKINGARRKILSLLYRMRPNIHRALQWKSGHNDFLNQLKPHFLRWDYSLRREGAFYTIKPLHTKPLVSVVIRTQNRPYFLREALRSLSNQTYTNVEAVVVEDGPPDTKEVIKEFPGLKVRYFSTGEAQGRCRAGNLGMEKARGKYINFLDDDDLFFADHLEVLVGELENDASARSFAYSLAMEAPTELISTDPLVYKEMDYRTTYKKPFDREVLKKENYIPINCALFARDLFLKEGGLDEDLDLLEDWDMWLRYSKHTDFIFVPKSTCLYRVPASRAIFWERARFLREAYKAVVLKHAEG